MAAPFSRVVEWAHEYLREHPDASVDDLAREAHAADVASGRTILSDIRRRWREQNAAAPTPPPPVIPAKPTIPPCRRCGGPHYISQCDSIAPLTFESTLPGLTETQVVATAVRTAIEDLNTEIATAKEQLMEVEKQAVKEEGPGPAVEIKTMKDGGSTRSAQGVALRRERLNQLLEEDPGADPLMLVARIREEFGRGLDWRYVYATCRVAREIHHLPQLDERPYAERPFKGRHSLPSFQTVAVLNPVPPELDDDEPLSPEEEMAFVARKLAEVIRAHGLTDVSITVTGGEMSWDYRIRRQGQVKL